MKLGLLVASCSLFVMLGQDAASMAQMGVRYQTGQGVAKDMKKAVYWWRKAAELGSAESQFYLGRAYQTGKGVEKDMAQAEYWYRKAADGGDARGRNSLEDLEQRRVWAGSHSTWTPLDLCPNLGSVPYCKSSLR
jgi:TPR repeat protein